MQSNTIKFLTLTLLIASFNQTLKCNSPLALALRIAVLNNTFHRTAPTTLPAAVTANPTPMVVTNDPKPMLKPIVILVDKRARKPHAATTPTNARNPRAKRTGARNRGAGNRY